MFMPIFRGRFCEFWWGRFRDELGYFVGFVRRGEVLDSVVEEVEEGEMFDA